MRTNRESPLRVMFFATSLPVGGAETLLMNLVQSMDRTRFEPEIACLKERGPLGDELAHEMPVHSGLLASKFDVRVLPRTYRLLKQRKIDAVVTVGAGDKMFWGRLAAKLAGVPVILSALHSTGWPDSVGRLNRLLTPITDGFIGVANAHAEHLACREGFPRDRVHTIYNGVDTQKFSPSANDAFRSDLGVDRDAPIVGILAALRPEKNHELFLSGAKKVLQSVPTTQFVVIGDGERRGALEAIASSLGIDRSTHFIGSRDDVHEILPSIDVVALTSHNEASPVSILEALSCGVPVVSARVGSVPETVIPGRTGELFEPGDLDGYVSSVVELLQNATKRRELGRQGREHVVECCSLEAMVADYQRLIESIYDSKQSVASQPTGAQQTGENPAKLRSSASHSSA